MPIELLDAPIMSVLDMCSTCGELYISRYGCDCISTPVPAKVTDWDN